MLLNIIRKTLWLYSNKADSQGYDCTVTADDQIQKTAIKMKERVKKYSE